MTKKSIVLFSLMLVTLIPCKSGGNVMTETVDPDLLRTIFEYDENQLAIRNLVTNDETKLQQFRKAMRKSFSQGYEEGDANNFIAYFECAIDNQKTLMEVYKEPKTMAIWKKQQMTIDKVKRVELPADIKDMIMKNDKWIPKYEAELYGNGYTSDHGGYSTLHPEIMGPIPYSINGKSSTEIRSTKMHSTKMHSTKIHSTKMHSTKMHSTKIRPTKLFSSEEAQIELLVRTTKSALNWFNIVTCSKECPPYVIRLQNNLQQIQADNPGVYENVHHIYWRFAIHIARSYNIMCTTHHKLMKRLKDYLSRNGDDKTFEQLLFNRVPSWTITYEQIFFLNVLKDARDPNHQEPLRYYSAINNEGKLTFIIYDDSSKCPRDQLLKRPTIKIPPLVYRSTRIFKNRYAPMQTEKIKHPSPRKPRPK